MSHSYRVPAHVISAHLADEAVLLNMDTKDYFQLNVTGQHIWRLIEQGMPAADIIADITAHFDVSAGDAAAEYDRITAELAASALVEVTD